MNLQFTKMHCCGNDYIVADSFTQRIYDPFTMSLILNDRHFGIGADAMMVLSPCEGADAEISFFSADGEENDPSGCGLRCAVKYLHSRILEKDEYRIKIGDETVSAYQTASDERSNTAEVCEFHPLAQINAPEKVTVSLMGNEKDLVLHPVIYQQNKYLLLLTEENFVQEEGIEKVNLASVASGLGKLQNYAGSPLVLAELCQKESDTAPQIAKVRVWKSGVGEIRSNANAAACVSSLLYSMKRTADSETLKLALQGGEILSVCEKNTLSLTGSVTEVFTGTVGKA